MASRASTGLAAAAGAAVGKHKKGRRACHDERESFRMSSPTAPTMKKPPTKTIGQMKMTCAAGQCTEGSRTTGIKISYKQWDDSCQPGEADACTN